MRDSRRLFLFLFLWTNPKKKKQKEKFGGERGIRTLDRLLTYTPLAGARLRPLGHLSTHSKTSGPWSQPRLRALLRTSCTPPSGPLHDRFAIIQCSKLLPLYSGQFCRPIGQLSTLFQLKAPFLDPFFSLKVSPHCKGAARILADDRSVKLDLLKRLKSSLDWSWVTAPRHWLEQLSRRARGSGSSYFAIFLLLIDA